MLSCLCHCPLQLYPETVCFISGRAEWCEPCAENVFISCTFFGCKYTQNWQNCYPNHLSLFLWLPYIFAAHIFLNADIVSCAHLKENVRLFEAGLPCSCWAKSRTIVQKGLDVHKDTGLILLAFILEILPRRAEQRAAVKHRVTFCSYLGWLQWFLFVSFHVEKIRAFLRLA